MKRPYAFGPMLAGLLITSAPADRVDDVGYFMNWATSLSGYEATKELPTVYLLSNQEIQSRYCTYRQVSTVNCAVGGFYRGGNELFVNRDQPIREIEATIVHELVHFLQFKHDKFTSRCQAELEANHVEWSYNAVVYASPDEFVFNRSWYNC